MSNTHILCKTLVPHWEGFFDELLNGHVDVAVLAWMEAVDITGKLHAAVVYELYVRRQPLVSGGPVQFANIPRINREAGFFSQVRFPEFLWDHLSFPGPLVDGIFDANYFLGKEEGPSIHERIHGRMDKILHGLIGVGMPVRAGCLVGLQLSKRFLQIRVQIGRHKDVRLGDAEGCVERRRDPGALKVFGLVAQFEDALYQWDERNFLIKMGIGSLT